MRIFSTFFTACSLRGPRAVYIYIDGRRLRRIYFCRVPVVLNTTTPTMPDKNKVSPAPAALEGDAATVVSRAGVSSDTLESDTTTAASPPVPSTTVIASGLESAARLQVVVTDGIKDGSVKTPLKKDALKKDALKVTEPRLSEVRRLARKAEARLQAARKIKTKSTHLPGRHFADILDAGGYLYLRPAFSPALLPTLMLGREAW